MKRNELIDAILTRTGVPAEQRSAASERYSDLSDSELVEMDAELAGMAAFGRTVRPTSPDLAQTLADILVESKEAMTAWRCAIQNLTPHAGGATPQPSVDPAIRKGRDIFPADLLARTILERIAQEITDGRGDAQVVAAIQDRFGLTVSEFLSSRLSGVAYQAMRLVLDRISGDIGGFEVDANVARALAASEGVWKPSFLLTGAEVNPTVIDGLARAALFCRALHPARVMEAKSGWVFARFLAASQKFTTSVALSAPAPVAGGHRGDEILLAVDAAHDPREMMHTVEEARRSHNAKVTAICLMGSPEVSRLEDGDVRTMIVAADNDVRTPWDPQGDFKRRGNKLIFGVEDEFVIHTADFNRHLEQVNGRAMIPLA